MSVPDVGKKGAGVLRSKPNIKWNKDRGKDVESAPWYPLFKGERINDYHLSLEKKLKAREKKMNILESDCPFFQLTNLDSDIVYFTVQYTWGYTSDSLVPTKSKNPI